MSIYIITHKKFDQPRLPGYKSLLVGAHKGHIFGDCFDDEGDNISHKNPYYCELTGLYWMWKNTKDDYLGLVHYRRYFSRSFRKKIISEEDIIKKLKKYDIVLPNRVYLYQTVANHFMNTFTTVELKEIENSIRKLYPDYLDTYKEVMDGNMTYFCNMMICRRELMESYCQWLFSILFDMEQRIDMTNYTPYQKRLYGFVSERLLTVWALHNKLKICELGIINTETHDNPVKEIAKGFRRVISYNFPESKIVNNILKTVRTKKSEDAN